MRTGNGYIDRKDKNRDSNSSRIRTTPNSAILLNRKVSKSYFEQAVPGYDTESALALLYEAALRKAYEDMDDNWNRNTDLPALIVKLAEYCFTTGIPEEEVVRRTLHHFYAPQQSMLVREMIGNIYKDCKNEFGKKDNLTKEQHIALQTAEFMNRRYEFRHNTQIGDVEYVSPR